MDLLSIAIKISEKAGKRILKEEKKLSVSKKGLRDLVTNADLASEELIIKEVKKKFPDHAIIAEESSLTNKKELKKLIQAPYIWIIDPLDGTTNFAHKIPNFAVSIGVFKTAQVEESKNFEYLEGELVCGVVFAPKLGDLYYAEKGKGAYYNGKKMQVSSRKNLEDAVVCTGFPYKNKSRNMPYLTAILEKVRGTRRFGAAALDMCAIARGQFDAYWEFGLKAWDVAAGALIISEAGGKITDTNGELLDLFAEDMLCTNSHLHPDMLKTFEGL